MFIRQVKNVLGINTSTKPHFIEQIISEKLRIETQLRNVRGSN